MDSGEAVADVTDDEMDATASVNLPQHGDLVGRRILDPVGGPGTSSRSGTAVIVC